MAWQADSDSLDDDIDDSFDADDDDGPLDDDMDDADTGDWDETPLPDPTGPGLVTVIGMWLLLGAPVVFLLPMALGGLMRGELEGLHRWLAVGVVFAAGGALYTLVIFTRRYLAGRHS